MKYKDKPGGRIIFSCRFLSINTRKELELKLCTHLRHSFQSMAVGLYWKASNPFEEQTIEGKRPIRTPSCALPGGGCSVRALSPVDGCQATVSFERLFLTLTAHAFRKFFPILNLNFIPSGSTLFPQPCKKLMPSSTS